MPLRRAGIVTNTALGTAPALQRIASCCAASGERRHCEERSDEAIQCSLGALDCFAALAMTAGFRHGPAIISSIGGDGSPLSRGRQRRWRDDLPSPATPVARVLH